MEKERKNPIDRLWDLFASIKLAVVLFALIAGTSIVGTIIEQNASPEKNLKVLERLIGPDMAPTAYKVLYSLGFMDMYHSWWFVTLLVLFAVNLIICSLDRLPRIWKLVKEPVRPVNLERIPSYPIKKELTVKGTPEGVRENVLAVFKSLGLKPENSPIESGGYQLYSQKGGWTRLGVYITHLSILVIMIGAVIGIFFGFHGFLNLPEGYTSSVAYARGTSKAHELGFSVRCDDFDVEFYGMSEMPKDYRSWLTVIDNGKEVVRKMIEVNEPLRYKGYIFYQSSYGMMPNIKQGLLILKVTGPGGRTETVTRRLGETFTIPGTDITGKIKDFSPALATDSSGRTYTYSNMMNNPAAYIEFSKKGTPLYSGWILKRFPRTWNLPDGNRVEFVDLWGVQYTGLQVRKDPGVWLVYLGCVVMAFGLYTAFFMNHRRLWAVVRKDGRDNTLITFLGTANKGRQHFANKVESAISKMFKKSKEV
ncbi:MAG: cytochrome c biogenesis protein ResB [Nitrospirae bacterium]|nr:MAG: cytochrome c biogenesis protein ResB [Nitrospirota bacterium]